MIWLASFPRSGNTFFRNILFEVYGIESSTFHMEDYPVDPNYQEYAVVKTHLLPHQLVPASPEIKSVYLVRDGRDCMVSLAHQRSEIIAPGSDFLENMEAAIRAAGGSFFGGWGENVMQWIDRADIIIRYEDLVKDPIAQVERLRAIMDLPEPKVDRLPTFDKLKFGTPKYGSKKNVITDEEQQKEFSKKFFRKGKAGGWKAEMPPHLHLLFWQSYGTVMEKMGYSFEGEIGEVNPHLNWSTAVKLAQTHEADLPKNHIRVLIEATKLADYYTDGVKRYLISLLSEMKSLSQNPHWQVDLFIAGKTIPIESYSPASMLQEAEDQIPGRGLFSTAKNIARNLLPRKTYNKSAELYRKLRYRLKLKEAGLMGQLGVNTEDPFSDYDLIHVPLFQNFEPFNYSKGPFLFTVHDFTHHHFPEFHTDRNIKLAEEGFEFSKQKKAHYLAISHASAADLLKVFPESAHRSSVIYEAADNALFFPNSNTHLAALVREKYGLGHHPFLLCLSTIEPRKNLLRTVQAFVQFKKECPESPLRLAIAGNKGWKHNELFAREESRHPDILFTGYVDEGHLSVLYSEAWALVYCSLYEGFGLPILEALSCGTPVVAGNNSSLPELVGEAGILCQADNTAAIAAAMQEMSSAEIRNGMADKAIAQSLHFSWYKAASETVELYRKVIAENYLAE